jgi:AcrR family transcriptional regulator
MSATTQRALLDSALRLFSENGYAHTSLQEIAESAGLTKGALYHHFVSKEDVLRRLHDEMIEHGISESRAVLALDLPPDQALCALIRAHVRMVETHKAAIAVFLRERKAFGPLNRMEIKEQRDEIEQAFLGVVERGQATGCFRTDASPRLVVYAILGMINWASEWYQPAAHDAGEISEVFCALTLSGLVPAKVNGTSRNESSEWISS